MSKCPYTGLIGIVLDKVPSEKFIKAFTKEGLMKVVSHYALLNCNREPDTGVASVFWGLDYLDNAFSVDLRDGMNIKLKFSLKGDIFVPGEDSCDCSTDLSGEEEKRTTAMREMLSQCVDYLPENRKGKYFMLTIYDKGCCSFKGGIIIAKLDDVENLL